MLTDEMLDELESRQSQNPNDMNACLGILDEMIIHRDGNESLNTLIRIQNLMKKCHEVVLVYKTL